MDAVLEPSMITAGGKGNENIGDYCQRWRQLNDGGAG